MCGRVGLSKTVRFTIKKKREKKRKKKAENRERTDSDLAEENRGRHRVRVCEKMGPRKCEVCNEALSKYKCPSCLVP